MANRGKSEELVSMIKILFICHGNSKVYIADHGTVGQNAANRGS